MKEKRFTPNVPGSEKTVTTKNGRTLLTVKCAICGINKTRFLADKKRGPALTSIKPLASFRDRRKGERFPAATTPVHTTRLKNK